MANTYITMKRRQQKEVDDFPMFAAFSENALREGMKELGLADNEGGKLTSLGCGVFIRTADVPAWESLTLRHKQERNEAILADKKGTGFIREMFSYELSNHEYCFTLDLTDTLEALGLTADQINASPAMRRGLHLAIRDQDDCF